MQMDKYIGLRVRIKMAAPLTEEHVGDLFDFDEKTGCVALRTLEANNNTTFSLIKSDCIANVECISSVPNPDVVNVRLPPIDFERLRAKETKALDNEAKKMQKIGQNVSQMAQQIFDALSFTLPCEWAGQCIRLPDLDLELRPPYTEDAISSISGIPLTQDHTSFFRKSLAKAHKDLGTLAP